MKNLWKRPAVMLAMVMGMALTGTVLTSCSKETEHYDIQEKITLKECTYIRKNTADKNGFDFLLSVSESGRALLYYNGCWYSGTYECIDKVLTIKGREIVMEELQPYDYYKAHYASDDIRELSFDYSEYYATITLTEKNGDKIKLEYGRNMFFTGSID